MRYDFSKIYNTDNLKYWKTRYPGNLEWNFDNLMLSNLYSSERRSAYGSRLEFPLVPHTNFTSSPFSFYASVSEKVIYVPISSIKFLDDLSIASAWLLENNYSQETLIDYITILKYSFNRFPQGQIPDPLRALHIPSNALNDSKVDDLAQKILKSVIIWIVGHELGHIIYNHPSYSELTFAESQACEKQADAFGTDMFRRIGTPPLGIVLLFNLFTSFFRHRGDFINEEDWQRYLKNSTHPISNFRLKEIANELINTSETFVSSEPDQEKARNVAEYVGSEAKRIAEIIDSANMQKFLKARALAVNIQSLLPRKMGDIVLVDSEYSEDKFLDDAFSGIYHGMHSRELSSGKTESLQASVIFYRSKLKVKVKGRFSFGIGVGTLSGYIDNTKLMYSWEWGDSFGKGVLTATNKNSFSGHWGYNEHSLGGGTWDGRKSIEPISKSST